MAGSPGPDVAGHQGVFGKMATSRPRTREQTPDEYQGVVTALAARGPSGEEDLEAEPGVYALFPGGVGNTCGNKDNFTSLINDVEHNLCDRLPDETWFYPGHGRDSTLGAERPHLGEWRARGW